MLKLGKAGNGQWPTTQRHCPVSVDQAIYTCVRMLIGGLPGALAVFDSAYFMEAKMVTGILFLVIKIQMVLL